MAGIKVHVGGLKPETTDATLKAALQGYFGDTVLNVAVIYNRASRYLRRGGVNACRGWGYVWFADQASADAAMAAAAADDGGWRRRELGNPTGVPNVRQVDYHCCGEVAIAAR